MANISTNIRYYQPNDPYYYEVDNLPLTDLLNNDIILEDRIKELEGIVTGFGSGTKGAFPIDAISDLKAYTEVEDPASWGKVFVRPGKFTARTQLPATRERGWRMMRDASDVFNNESFAQPSTGTLNTTTLSNDFVRQYRAIGRTAVHEFYPNVDLSDKSISIEAFKADEFNSASPPTERLRLDFC